MKMKHDNLWRANPDTAEEMDEIERRRKRAMRTAITLLALAVAVNVAVNEFSCVGPSPSKRDAAPAVQQSAPDDRGGAGQAGADADGEEPALSLDIAPDQAEATRVDQDAVRAALGAYCKEKGIEASRAYVSVVLSFPSSTASSYLEVELLDSDGSKAADVGVAYSLDYGTCTVVPLESLTGGSEKPERIERGGDAL